MIGRTMISTALRHYLEIVPSQISSGRFGFHRSVCSCMSEIQRSGRQSHFWFHPLSIKKLRFEQRKFISSMKETECSMQKDGKESEYVEMECNGEKIHRKETESSENTTKESTSGLEIVERIMVELRENGKHFILPVNDAAAMEIITEPFRLFLDIGIRPEFIVDSCVCVPRLFTSLTQKGETSIQIIELIVDFCQLTYEDSIRLFATYNEELLGVGPEEIQKCMEVLEAYGFEDKILGEAICSCPALLFAQKSERLAQNAENLFSHFTKNQLYSLLKSSPELLIGTTDETEDKIEYIYCHMLMEGEDFAGCTKLAEISLNELMDRHEFLLKTGTYKTPDAKRPQLKMENPKLKKILDSNAEYFAEKIAHVSVKEWYLFQELQNKQRALETETDGKVRPFERIKPSMRKRTERKRKTLQLSDSETFESYNLRY